MRYSFRLLLISILAVFLVGPPSNIKAQNAAGITVTPVTDVFDIIPGKTVTRTVRVINPVVKEITLYPRALDFHTDNEKGQPSFFTPKDKTSRWTMSQWMTFSKPFLRIAPNEEEKFDVIINAPENADPGGHYAAILFSTEEPKLDEDVSQIGVVGLVGTLLLAKVPGEIIERLTLEEFVAPRILISPPANFSILFSNSGNVHLRPAGELKIRNWFGDTSAAIKINEGEGNVLPESKRRFETSWQFDWKAFGRYTATTALYYGTEEKQLIATRSFIIIPIWFIIVFALLVLRITFAIFKRRQKKKVVAPPPPPPTAPVSAPPKIVMR
ncbi:MAG: DUF916 domain-containing protein [Candidatus Berkelbacteria bacterium]|nr:DUF916 domain-containing protein [Candidatus Berkelbacteria bacterium]